MDELTAGDQHAIRSRPSAVVIGDINIDIIFNSGTFPEEGDDLLVKTSDQRLGGSGCNTAVALSKLGIRTKILGHLGRDAFGVIARKSLEESGVDTASVLESQFDATGWMMILVTSGGQRTIFGHRGCNGLPFPDQEESRIWEGQNLLHVSGYTFLEDEQWISLHRIISAAHSRGLSVSLDPGIESIRKVKDRVFSVLPYVDYLLISEFEYSKLIGDRPFQSGCRELLTRGVKSVILKRGAEGSLCVTEDQECSEPAFDLPGYRVSDTTGAGDCFDAGFLDGRLQGLTSSESLVLGNAVAYCTITSRGGMEDLRHQPSLNPLLLKMILAKEGMPGDSSMRNLSSILGPDDPKPGG